MTQVPLVTTLITGASAKPWAPYRCLTIEALLSWMPHSTAQSGETGVAGDVRPERAERIGRGADRRHQPLPAETLHQRRVVARGRHPQVGVTAE